MAAIVTDLYNFLPRCDTAYSLRIFTVSPPISLLTYLQK